MVILIVRFHNPKIHLVRNPQDSAVSTYDPHLVRIHLVRKFFKLVTIMQDLRHIYFSKMKKKKIKRTDTILRSF